MKGCKWLVVSDAAAAAAILFRRPNLCSGLRIPHHRGFLFFLEGEAGVG